jgi:large subunit ribosomal protein L10
MPKTKEQKASITKDLTDYFARQKSVVFIDFRGLGNKAIVGIRGEIRKEALEYKVAKKTLLRRALKDAGLPELPYLEGEIAVVFGFSDEVAPARLLHGLAKTNDKLKVLGGILENAFIGKDEVVALAKIPSKQELFARLVGTINAPVQNFVYVLNGNIGNFVRVLQALSQRP